MGVLRHYDHTWLRRDLVAGVVLAAILVPQGTACSISNDARLSVRAPRSEGDA